MNPYQKLLSRKRTWTPVQVEAGKFKEGSEEAMLRALALRNLEIPVGDFIQGALKKDFPIEAKELLESNIKDEEKHDLALDYIAKAHKLQDIPEANAIQKAWIEAPEHPVLKAMVLERSVFFVLLPFFRWNGDAGCRTVSADISRDEQVHVASNSLVCKELGITVTQNLDKLRKATVAWIMQPLGSNPTDPYLDREFWLKQSDSLLYSGKAEGLVASRRARMPAFFEHSNVNLPEYG